jgi:uncharacterized protein YuzE
MKNSKIKYFEQEDIWHLTISEEPEASRIELSPNITLELNKEGELIGMEITNASTIEMKGNGELTPQERAKKWLDFVATLPKTSANLPDEALHCDSMYD